MQRIPQWCVAQKGEKELWDGVIHLDYYILSGLAANSVKAPMVRSCLKKIPDTCLEIGIGPFGIGISGFLPEIRNRFGVDPLARVPLNNTSSCPRESSEVIRNYMQQLRADIRYIVACGEELPLSSGSMDLVICCNVLDHASHPTDLLREIYRVMKPDGLLFLDIDTFSILGLAKWYSWTRYAHKNETLVTTHPHRMYEADVLKRLRTCGFHLRKVAGHSVMSNLIGHARDSTFLGTK